MDCNTLVSRVMSGLNIYPQTCIDKLASLGIVKYYKAVSFKSGNGQCKAQRYLIFCGLGTPLSCGPMYLSPSILYSIGCWPVTLGVNVLLTKRLVHSCSAMPAAAVKLLVGSRVYL